MSDKAHVPSLVDDDLPDDQAAPDVSTDPDDTTAISVEFWGVKVKIPFQPSPAGEKPPTSWKQVAGRVNRRLMAIAVGLFGAAQDLVDGTRAVIRGAAKIPPESAAKVKRARSKADHREGVRQGQVESGTLPPMLPSAPQDILEDLLLRKRAEGHEASIVDLGSGRIAIVFVKAGDGRAALEHARKTLPEETDIDESAG